MQTVVKMFDYGNDFLTPEITDLPKRRINEKTTRYWGYGKAEYHGKKVQVASTTTRKVR